MQIQSKKAQGAQQQHKASGGHQQKPQQSQQNPAFAGIKLPPGGLAR